MAWLGRAAELRCARPDLIFNFHKAYYILDEVFLAGELQESSKRQISRVVAEHDALAEDEEIVP